jgi:hypothetical protein
LIHKTQVVVDSMSGYYLIILNYVVFLIVAGLFEYVRGDVSNNGICQIQIPNCSRCEDFVRCTECDVGYSLVQGLCRQKTCAEATGDQLCSACDIATLDCMGMDRAKANQ